MWRAMSANVQICISRSCRLVKIRRTDHGFACFGLKDFQDILSFDEQHYGEVPVGLKAVELKLAIFQRCYYLSTERPEAGEYGHLNT